MRLDACGVMSGDPESRALRNVAPLHVLLLSRRFVGESVHKSVVTPIMGGETKDQGLQLL